MLVREIALNRFARERPRTAAIAAFSALMAVLMSVYALSPAEARFAGDLGGATIRVNGKVIAGPVARIWPAGGFDVCVQREGSADVLLKAEVHPLGRVAIAIPPGKAPVSSPGTVADKPAGPVTEEEIAAAVEMLERATDDHLLTAVPSTEREAALTRTGAIRAFARCRSARKYDRSVLVFAPACAWARFHPGAFATDPWDAAVAAADIAPPVAAARAALCLARLALALGRDSESRALFEKTATEAFRQAHDGDLKGAIEVTREALALSPPDEARLKLENVLARCLAADR